MGIVIITEHCVSNESATKSSELRHHCSHISLLLKSCFCDWFPQIPVQLSNEYTRTGTLNYNPNLFLDGTCHKTQSQINRPPSIEHHTQLGKPLPPSIHLLSTCALTSSLHSSHVIYRRRDKAATHP